MHTVVYAFDDFDMTVEKRVLSALDAEVICLKNLDSPESHDILGKADALVITLQKLTGASHGFDAALQNYQPPRRGPRQHRHPCRNRARHLGDQRAGLWR